MEVRSSLVARALTRACNDEKSAMRRRKDTKAAIVDVHEARAVCVRGATLDSRVASQIGSVGAIKKAKERGGAWLVPRVCTVLMMRPSSHYTRNMRLFSRDFRIFMPILQGRMRKAKRDKKHDDTSMQGSLGGMLTRQEREGGATINVGGAHPPCSPSPSCEVTKRRRRGWSLGG